MMQRQRGKAVTKIYSWGGEKGMFFSRSSKPFLLFLFRSLPSIFVFPPQPSGLSNPAKGFGERC